MSSNLKKLVNELERVLIERGGSLDAPARDAFKAQLNDLKMAIEAADDAEESRLQTEVLDLLAKLLSIITNVMSLLS